MDIQIRAFTEKDVLPVIEMWNYIVEQGISFPHLELLTEESGIRYFNEQSFTGVAPEMQGCHIGEKLVRHSMGKGTELGFRILQFNTVLKNNVAALRLYKKLGFTQLGTIPGGFRMKDGTYADIIPHYIEL